MKIRLGVIGAGKRGWLAALAHRPDAGVRVVACCDLEEAALKQCRERYGMEIFTTRDYRELLAQDLDAVFVTSPDFCHEEHAIAALNAGCAVYLEKPMALTVEGCDRIWAAASNSGSKLYLGHNMRHMPFVLAMKDLIAAGEIGEVKTIWCRHFVGHGGDYYFKDWHAERSGSNGLLLQKGCHDIDIIHWLAGAYSCRVNAMGDLMIYGNITDRQQPGGPRPSVEDLTAWPPDRQTLLNPLVDVEDVSLVNMVLTNGVLASYQQCHFTPDYWRSYTVIGSAGRMENFGDGAKGTVIKVWNKRHAGYDDQADKVVPVATEEGAHGGADTRIVDEFLAYVRNQAQPSTSPVDARQSVATAAAATDSLRHGGRAVEVSIIAPKE
ncbi:MAG: Gfo/Idh/MocA family oxidoreductase [Akkermansiaceae bacterium]